MVPRHESGAAIRAPPRWAGQGPKVLGHHDKSWGESHTCLSWSSAWRRLSASASKLAASKALTAARSMAKALIGGLFGPGGRVVALVVVEAGDKRMRVGGS